jgi:putative membrane protein
VQMIMNWKSAGFVPAVTALITGMCVLAGYAPPSAAGQKSQLSAQDSQFLMKAAQGGIAEVKMGQVAVKQAEDEDTKGLAHHIIKDHLAANKKLMKLASMIGVQPPKQTDQEHQQIIRQLAKKDTTLLDQTYIVEQIKGHKEMISIFQQEVKQGQNPQLVNFAKKTLPTLEEHLKMAQKLNPKTQ